MYPNLYFFLKETFGGEPLAFTRYINSFGLLVAIAFVIAGYVLSRELSRKERQGLLKPMEETLTVGEPASIASLAANFAFGFLFGYKIIGAFLNDGANPQEFIFSSKGSWPGGLLMAALFAGMRYYEKQKARLPKPEQRKVTVWPHERVGDIVIMAVIAGFLGAKIFDNLENWDRFIQNPIANLLAPSGLTFYGGLILATIVILRFARRKSIGIRHLVDAAAPALMISYAVGRIGCHVSGDGDWGIFNTAYRLDADGSIVASDGSHFLQTLDQNPAFTQYLLRDYGTVAEIPRAHVPGISLLPDWLWAYNYPHNVNEVGTPIPGCTGDYCMQLNPLVFPTPLYEAIACSLLFLLLWMLRKRITVPGRIFALYLALNGVERFLVEKIRVNTTYSLFGFHPTQAELISTLLVITGCALWWWCGKKAAPQTSR